jgi:CHASE1-domain containing sensor protein
VLVYDRSRRQLLELKEFALSQRADADEFRLAQQVDAYTQGLDREIVLFQAESREDLERSHGSYFLSLDELIEQAKSALRTS